MRSVRELRRADVQEAHPGLVPGARHPHHQGGLEPEAGRVGRPLQAGRRGQGPQGGALLVRRRQGLGQGNSCQGRRPGVYQVTEGLTLAHLDMTEMNKGNILR